MQLQQILWTCCVFLSSLNNTFFSMLVIIVSNKSDFCFDYMNTFFIHAMSYFSVVLRIIFLMCIKNYFLIRLRIFFCTAAPIALDHQSLAVKFRLLLHCGPCISSGLIRVFDFLRQLFWKLFKCRSALKENAKAKHCQGKNRKRFSSFLQNLSGASSLCVSDEVFLTENLIEETTKWLHDSYTNLIEHDMPAQMNSSLPNLVPRVFVPYYTCWLSEWRHWEWECPRPWSSGRSSRF